jgi:hypothetical protein
MARLPSDYEPFFRQYTNTEIAASTTSAPLIDDDDSERFGKFRYCLIKNDSTEEARVVFDSDADKSVRLKPSERLELVGTLLFENFQIENLDGSNALGATEFFVNVSNLLPQDTFERAGLLERGSARIENGRVII